MKTDLDLKQEYPLTTYGPTQGPKKRITRLRCPAFTSEEWRSKNPLLQKGEFGVETDSYSIKVGDGFTRWNDLPYTSSTGTTAWGNIGGVLANQQDLSRVLADKADITYVDDKVQTIEYPVFAVGREGLVPAPTSSDARKCLLGDGTWGVAGDSLPAQSGQSNKFLRTNGTAAYWDTALVAADIATTISSSSVNTKPAGAKAVYDHVLALNTSVQNTVAGLQTQINSKIDASALNGYATTAYVDTKVEEVVNTAVTEALGDIEAALATI